jgi:hypothetical protein
MNSYQQKSYQLAASSYQLTTLTVGLLADSC